MFKDLFFSSNTIKYGYIGHAFNELTLTAMGFSLPVIFLHVVKLTDIKITLITKQNHPSQALCYKRVLLFLYLFNN